MPTDWDIYMSFYTETTMHSATLGDTFSLYHHIKVNSIAKDPNLQPMI